MICNTCGRSINNEEANFCEYCGSSLRRGSGFEFKTAPVPPVYETVNVDPKEKPVSFLNWLGTYLLMFIPFVGSFVFLAMLFVWAFGRNVQESKKNWARANLVFMLIVFVMIILLFTAFSPDQLFNIMFGDTGQFSNIY